MKSKELSTYLERLRSARGISQYNFIEDVVSIRQYRRYLRGESDIPFQVVNQLSEKLGVNADLLLREFEIAKFEESSKMYDLYSYAANYAHDDFKKLAKEISPEHIIDANNKLIYNYSFLMHNYFQNLVSPDDTLKQMSQFINYPRILNQLMLTHTEMLILSNLLDFIDEKEHSDIIEKLQNSLDKSIIILSGGNHRATSIVLVRLAKYFGMRGQYNDVIKYCNVGIDFMVQRSSLYSLDYFHYYSALAHFKLNDLVKYEESLVNCYFVLQVEGNPNKTKKFTSLIQKDFGIDLNQFVIYYLNRTQK